ncbi:MAG: AAA family ATPase [Planctomycetaceae bacterium]|nr:AAA family ATPase [Planctomycetaceae bacterium]
MKINGFEIERFGIWSGLTVSKLFDGVNVFYGANEAGKSTIMEFIRAGLYGFDDKRRQYARRTCGQNNAPENAVDQNGNPLYAISGGELILESASGTYNLKRMFHPDGNEHFETVELRNANGEKEGLQLLRVLISGVDEQTFNNVFAIGLDEIQRIGTLNDTDAAEMLFQLSVGMERVSIVDAIKELTNCRNRILNPLENENKPSLLTQLIIDRKKILDEIDETKLLVREYVHVKDELKIVDRSVAILEDELAVLEREKRLYEIAKITEPMWIRRNKIRHEIDAMGKVLVVQDEMILKLDKLTNELNENRKTLQDIKTEYKFAKDEIKSQPVNEMLIKFAPRLEVLVEEESRIVEIDSQITSIENDIKSITSRIADEDNLIKRGRRTSSANVNLVPSTPSYHDERPVVANSTEHETINSNSIASSKNIFAGYRTAARALSKAKRRIHHVKEQYTEVLGRTKALGGKLKPELSNRNVNTISEAIDNAKELTAALRKRQSIGQHLSEMSLVHRDLHRANTVLVQNQTTPMWQVAVTGLFGVVGVIPAGLAIFETAGVRAFDVGIHPILVLGGLMLSGGAVAYKFISEKSNAGKLKQNQRQLNGLISQINHAKQEAAEIDSRFTDIISSSIDSRCRESQVELQMLEKLLPVENQYQQSSRNLKKIELRLQRCKELQSVALKRWQDWLRSVGLPVDWFPARVRELVEHSDSAHDLRRELERFRLLLEQRSNDMRTITDRIDRVIGEAGLTFVDGVSYVDILRNIKSMLEANDVAVRNRDKLKLGLRPFRKRRREAVARLSELRATISDLLRQFHVKNVDAMRELNKLHQRHRRLLQQEQGVQREIDAAIGDFCAESVIGDILTPRVEQKLRREFAQAENKNDAGIEIVNSNTEFDDVEIDEAGIIVTKNNSAKIAGDFNGNVEIGGDVNGVNNINDGNGGESKLLTIDQLLGLVSGRIDVHVLKLRGEIEARGKLSEQLKLLADDQTFYRKRRELSVIDERIRKLKFDWQVYSVCCLMLDFIRESYERERQPKTLAEASELLKKLTEGKYVRIWVPLGERVLMVDDVLGNTCDIGWISRGTRELLFIALRLALATAFAQHGSVLPIILDDVLVNFDAKRSRAMAKLLIEYAKSGRQIFVFTCHEHVCRIFQGLDVLVRILPFAGESSRADKVLLPRSVLKKREANRRREIQRLAKKQLEEKIQKELAKREDQIRIEEARKAEVQRMILQIQQQATAAITIEQNTNELQKG